MPATEETALLPTPTSRRRLEEPKAIPTPAAALPPEESDAARPVEPAVIIGLAGPQPASVTSTSELAAEPAEPEPSRSSLRSPRRSARGR